MKLLQGLTSDEAKTLDGWTIFYFGKCWRHMNTKNRSIKEVTVKGMCDKAHVYIQFFIIP